MSVVGTESVAGKTDLFLNWNMKNFLIRTKTVENILEPLVTQVTTLVSSKSSHKNKGKSKKARTLVTNVSLAINIFIEKGEMIAEENPDVKQEMVAILDEVRSSGKLMLSTAEEFAKDPCSCVIRSNLVRSSRSLLTAVTRLLILADEIYVHLLLKNLRRVENDLTLLKSVSSPIDLLEGMEKFGRSAAELTMQASRRQQELKDPVLRDDLASARAMLKHHSLLMLIANKTYMKHPEIAAAKYNKDCVLDQMCDTVRTIGSVLEGRTLEEGRHEGDLSRALEEFESGVTTFLEQRSEEMGCGLKESLEKVVCCASVVVDSVYTRDERREAIVSRCKLVRCALVDLVEEAVIAGEEDTMLEAAVMEVRVKTKDLRRHLRRAVVDQVSDCFLDCLVPIQTLAEAVKKGNMTESEVDSLCREFTSHSGKLLAISKLACSMSSSQEGVKMVRYAAQQVDSLRPLIVNAALILANQPESQMAQENMTAFKRAWVDRVSILTEAVDDIVAIDDILAVSECHILEDVNRCCLALQDRDAETLRNVTLNIRRRSSRICGLITQEMDNFESGHYTERVMEAARILKSETMSHFADQVEMAVSALEQGNECVDDNEFINASRLVYDGVREVRRAVLCNRREEDMDSDIEWEEADISEMGEVSCREHYESRSESMIDEYPDISGINNAREAMKKLPEEEKEKIQQQVEVFRVVKRAFDREVNKWDDQGNQVVILAKHMCVIMMEMTDFTRGKGKLKTTSDVIDAAKRISEAGTQLDKLSRQIAEQCPESTTKKDLLAYLQRIALYCHQLNITSKVKADVQNVSGELVVSGLDSATSLIQAAKNLMNSVVLTVKASYVASTKYRKTEQQAKLAPVVVWKMKPPEKLPLVRREAPEEVMSKVRRGSGYKVVSPQQILSDFEEGDE